MSKRETFPYEVVTITGEENSKFELRSPVPVDLPGCGATLACLFVVGDGIAQGDFGKILIGAAGLYYLNKIGRQNVQVQPRGIQDSSVEVSAESSVVS